MVKKIPKTYRLDPSTLESLERIRSHFDDRKQVAAQTLGVKYKEADMTEALEFAINFAKQQLENEGLIEKED
ncbi:hypothetical protein [Bacillus sp. B1-b2]|uniref:hypothetical protein n=1 Tax=Bacillus sp. B1-b2 TaxID=2653201 RepID=UPI0012620B00|nr:hypothetical protein [Bacillus sp. B1-b2]KAB7663030.1 hypothetical protein F9279_24355 [Bacillus sp. B1-b2]